MDDDPFITSTEMWSPLTTMAPPRDLCEDMAKTNALSRRVVTGLLAPDSDRSGGLGRVWPKVAPDYLSDIGMFAANPLDENAREYAKATLLDLDQSLAGQHLNPPCHRTPGIKDARVLYAVEFRADRDIIRCGVEFPPSAISTGPLVRQAFEARSIQIRHWSFDIQEGW